MDYHQLEEYDVARTPSRFRPQLYFIQKHPAPEFDNEEAYDCIYDDIVCIAVNVLSAYKDFHLRQEYDIPDLFAQIDELRIEGSQKRTCRREAQ